MLVKLHRPAYLSDGVLYNVEENGTEIPDGLALPSDAEILGPDHKPRRELPLGMRSGPQPEDHMDPADDPLADDPSLGTLTGKPKGLHPKPKPLNL